MKNYSLTLFCLFIGFIANTQSNFQLIEKGQTNLFQKKDGNLTYFEVRGKSYFITDYYESPTRYYHLECFDENGSVLGERKLSIPVGVLNNSFDFRKFVGLGNHAFALIEHLDKPAGKLTLSARKLNPNGDVSESEVELINYPFEKTLNSGFTYSSTSPNGQKLLVAAMLPYVKNESAKMKLAVYDTSLKLISSGEFEIPGEDTKNKRIAFDLANDGSVFMTKYINTKDNGILLSVMKWGAKTNKIEFKHDFSVGDENRIENYVQAINENNELVIAGVYYEFKNFTVNDLLLDGTFYFATRGNDSPIQVLSPLDAKIANLESQKIVFKDGFAYLGVSQVKTTRLDAPPGQVGAAALDYSYRYDHGNELIFGFNSSGEKLFQLNFETNFSATNFDYEFRPGYAFINGNFVIIYNDNGSKYLDPHSTGYRPVVPIFVAISSEGKALQTNMLLDKFTINYAENLHPYFAVQSTTNELVMLMRSNTYSKYVRLVVN